MLLEGGRLAALRPVHHLRSFAMGMPKVAGPDPDAAVGCMFMMMVIILIAVLCSMFYR